MVQHEIIGDDMQAVILSLGPGDVVRAEAGAMMFMTDAIEMDAKMDGGFLGGLKRKFLAGESFFITLLPRAAGRGQGGLRRPVSRARSSTSRSPRAAGALPEGLVPVRGRRRST